MRRTLPPAGERVVSEASAPDAPGFDAFISPYRATFYDSGTSALAAALISVAKGAPGGAEVLMPAYACPDLVSAAVFAGLMPVLVDFEAGRPWLDRADLERKRGRRTVAVVGVDFLGIPEQGERLREFARVHGLALIEDSAQRFEGLSPGRGWWGDYVVLSFGRGKPISLLGGGAVLTRCDHDWPELPRPGSADAASPARTVEFALKRRAYNALRHPRLFGLMASLPGLHLGETRYEALARILPMDEARRSALNANLAAHRRRSLAVQAWIAERVSGLDGDGLVDLPARCAGDGPMRLLRYPLLVADPRRRTAAVDHLNRAGLGASTMYPAVLSEMAGCRSLVAGERGSVPNAARFAGSVVTLPTHSSVSADDVDRMASILEKELAAG